MILPQTEWVQPTEYPDLRSYDEIAIDLETRDPDLKSKGSGACLLYTSPSPRDRTRSRMPSSA